MKTKLSIATFFIFVLLTSGQNSETMKAYSFTFPEFNDKRKLTSIIKGKTGKIYGKEAHIEGALVKIVNEKNPLTLTTDRCKYFLKDKRCSSNEAVIIKGDGVKITGIGFDIDNITRKIFIRSQVKVVWKKAKLKKRKETKKKEKKEK